MEFLSKHQVVGRLARYIDIFTDGFESENDTSPGYIVEISDALSGDMDLVKKNFKEHNVLGHLRALLLIAQTVRCDPDEDGYSRPAQCLPSKTAKSEVCIRRAKLNEPTAKQIAEGLRAYEILSDEETQTWLKEAAI